MSAENWDARVSREVEQTLRDRIRQERKEGLLTEEEVAAASAALSGALVAAQAYIVPLLAELKAYREGLEHLANPNWNVKPTGADARAMAQFAAGVLFEQDEKKGQA